MDTTLVLVVVAVLVGAAILAAAGVFSGPRRSTRRARVVERPARVVERPVERVVEEHPPVRRVVEERRIVDEP